MVGTDKIGVWLIGAGGHLATTLMAGATAIAKGITDCTAMVTELPQFSEVPFVGIDSLVFGGVDIREVDIRENAWNVHRSTGILSHELLRIIEGDLDSISENIVMGTAHNCGGAIAGLAEECIGENEGRLSETVEKISCELLEFLHKKDLKNIIVINLASTEPVLVLEKEHYTVAGLEDIIERDQKCKVRASTLYAYASIKSGFPYINFTPSNGALIPAIIELSKKVGVPVMGSDGKTGETLVKSALAPLFAQRNLNVLAWQGYNILGNRDGQVLEAPENKETKVNSKAGVLGNILGYEPHSHVGIDYVPSLDDWKTAWDFIHFEGFLGTKMCMQFIWQGCDSILAAPLVLDLIRLGEIAMKVGDSGLMPHLAFFFKSPIGVKEHNLSYQFQSLVRYLEDLKSRIRSNRDVEVEEGDQDNKPNNAGLLSSCDSCSYAISRNRVQY